MTLGTDTDVLKSGESVTILPCVSYKHTEYCQRMKIPARMSIPIHVYDVKYMEAYDTVRIQVNTNCIYTNPRQNKMTIVRLH